MKTREDIILDMCYTYRHDYGIEKSVGFGCNVLACGTNHVEKTYIYNIMAQIFDNCILPYMEFKNDPHS